MRVDANHAGNKQYAPNSFAHKFRPDAAEAPYKVSDNIVSRKSHYAHEGKKSEYDQARELYRRVMSSRARENTHANTAKMLRHVKYPHIQSNYLAQLHNIAPEYAAAVYDLLPDKKFDLAEVEHKAATAQEWYKEAKFRPGQGERLIGLPPGGAVYGM